jgi:hypothetical protein
MKSKKILVALLLFIFVILLAIAIPAAYIYYNYSQVEELNWQRAEETHVFIKRFAPNGGETQINIRSTLVGVDEDSYYKVVSTDEWDEEEMISYERYHTAVNDYIRINSHSNSYDEIYLDTWLADFDKTAAEVLFLGGFYSNAYPVDYTGLDLVDTLEVESTTAITEPSKSETVGITAGELQNLWRQQEDIAFISDTQASFSYENYGLWSIKVEEFEVSFEDGSSMLITIDTNFVNFEGSEDIIPENLEEEVSSATDADTFEEAETLSAAEIDDRMTIGDKNADKTLNVFIGDKCPSGNADCANFFWQVLPFLINSVESEDYNLRIRPYINNSGLSTAANANGLFCSAEQDKLAALLTEYADWSEDVSYNNEQKLEEFSSKTKDKFTELDVDQLQFRRCVNAGKYMQYTTSRFDAELNVDETEVVTVRLGADTSTDSVYPTQTRVEQLIGE